METVLEFAETNRKLQLLLSEILEKLTLNNREDLVSFKNQVFKFTSDLMKNYQIAVQNSNSMKCYFESIQNEAAREWNLRQMDLVRQIDLFEDQIQKLQKENKSFNQELNRISSSVCHLAKVSRKNFYEVLEILKTATLSFELQFKVEKNLLEIEEIIKGFSKQHTQYDKVTRISNLITPENSCRINTGLDQLYCESRVLEASTNLESTFSRIFPDLTLH